MFLGDAPGHRLFALFKEFPVLARLWSQLIYQWREHVTEVVSRFVADRRALSQSFFHGQPLETIVNIRCSLSDSHRYGRTVMDLQFESGAVIYKPRSGDGEWEWGSLLEWMNLHSFQPELRAARVLRRKGYCWMEHVKAAPCQSEAAARRFYQRMGGIIAAAHLLKAVDCHRDNIIASGEHPVLVDVDALWHVSTLSKTQSFSDVLHRTGFFPAANPRSLQSRSSALGPRRTGNHVPRLAGESLLAADYQAEIARGFARAWRCILGTANRREAFARRLRRIRSRERRWIYWATEKYAAIRKASIQPSVMRSGAERDLLIRRLCSRDLVPSTVVDAEILALKRLDIPYFERTTNEMPATDKLPVPEELTSVIRSALPDPRRASS
jgi:lantibiotic modifying enzyme